MSLNNNTIYLNSNTMHSFAIIFKLLAPTLNQYSTQHI